MSFIGIITNTKNETYIRKELRGNFKEEEIIFITDRNIENMRNIRFETIVMDTKLQNRVELKKILLKVKYLILNADIKFEPEMFEDLNLIVISYGFQNKATFTISSVSDNHIIICLQRIMRTISGTKYEPEEFEVRCNQNIDIHVILCLQIILLFYDKIHILAN